MATAYIEHACHELLVGKLLGEGIARKTYECKLLPDCVVKIEENGGSFQNILEWSVWEDVQWTDYRGWFAPCQFIAPDGSVLIQKKTGPVPDSKWPAKVPKFLTDIKKDNFGLYQGKVVCHDYGLGNFTKMLTKAQVKADWY
jgi:hypothetical protein